MRFKIKNEVRTLGDEKYEHEKRLNILTYEDDVVIVSDNRNYIQ